MVRRGEVHERPCLREGEDKVRYGVLQWTGRLGGSTIETTYRDPVQRRGLWDEKGHLRMDRLRTMRDVLAVET